MHSIPSLRSLPNVASEMLGKLPRDAVEQICFFLSRNAARQWNNTISTLIFLWFLNKSFKYKNFLWLLIKSLNYCWLNHHAMLTLSSRSSPTLSDSTYAIKSTSSLVFSAWYELFLTITSYWWQMPRLNLSDVSMIFFTITSTRLRALSISHWTKDVLVITTQQSTEPNSEMSASPLYWHLKSCGSPTEGIPNFTANKYIVQTLVRHLIPLITKLVITVPSLHSSESRFQSCVLKQPFPNFSPLLPGHLTTRRLSSMIIILTVEDF